MTGPFIVTDMIPCRTAAYIASGNQYRHIIPGALLFEFLFRTKNTGISKIRNTKKWSVFMAGGAGIAIDTFAIGSATRTDAGKQAVSAGNSG